MATPNLPAHDAAPDQAKRVWVKPQVMVMPAAGAANGAGPREDDAVNFS